MSFSSLSMIVAVGSIVHIVLRYTPSILIVLGTFIMKGHWIFSKSSSESKEMITWFLSLNLLMLKIKFLTSVRPISAWRVLHLADI